MVVCIQCLMRAFLAGLKYEGEPEDTPEAHMTRAHPDPIETHKERIALEQQITQILQKMKTVLPK